MKDTRPSLDADSDRWIESDVDPTEAIGFPPELEHLVSATELQRAKHVLAGAALRELVFGQLRPMAEAFAAARKSAA